MHELTREQEIEAAWAAHWTSSFHPRQGWLEILFEKYVGICLYCDARLCLEDRESMLRPTIDHFVPLARGGEDNIENCVLACYLCNSAKGELSHFDAVEIFARRAILEEKWR